MSIQLKVSYLDSVPIKEKQPTYSKYALELRKFLLMKQPVAQIKLPSTKQATTVAASFRREIAKYEYTGVSVRRMDKTVFLVKKTAEGEE